MVLSSSNLPRRTQRWKEQSSIYSLAQQLDRHTSTPGTLLLELDFFLPLFSLEINNLSFKPTDRLSPRPPYTETTLGHAGKIGLHDNLTNDFAVKNTTSLRLRIRAAVGLIQWECWRSRSYRWRSRSYGSWCPHDAYRMRERETARTYQSMAPVIWEVMEVSVAVSSTVAVPKWIRFFMTSIAQFWG